MSNNKQMSVSSHRIHPSLPPTQSLSIAVPIQRSHVAPAVGVPIRSHQPSSTIYPPNEDDGPYDYINARYFFILGTIVCCCGAQRYYLDQPCRGAMMCVTCGCLGILQVIDWFQLQNLVDIANARVNGTYDEESGEITTATIRRQVPPGSIDMK